MPCPRPKRYQQGKKIPYGKRVKILGGSGAAVEPAQAAQDEAQAAPEPPPVSGPQPVDWDNAGTHVGCGGEVKNASTTLPRRWCKRCKAEWWWQNGWKRV